MKNYHASQEKQDKMEFNDLDGYDDAIKAREIKETLTRHYRNATASALARNEPLLRKELSAIEGIISSQVDEANELWLNFQWVMKDPSLDQESRQELFEAYPFYKAALKAAEVAARNYRESASKLLTLCQRKSCAA